VVAPLEELEGVAPEQEASGSTEASAKKRRGRPPKSK
jgi:hypothetical protein